MTGEDDKPKLTITFPTVSEADGYLLNRGDDAEPIRVEPQDCGDDVCEVVLDRLTAGVSSSVTVSSVSGDEVSEPSDTADVPTWPDSSESGPTEPPNDEPIDLVIVRMDDDKPVIEYETVPADGDVEERIDELKRSEDVAEVSVASATEIEGSSDDDPSGDEALNADFPAGITTWQQEALNFDALPEEPRGEGVTVAVIDDGIASQHPSFRDADITETNVVEPDRSGGPGEHGTSVTSMIVGAHDGMVPGIATGTTIRAYDVRNYGGESEGNNGDVAEGILQAVDDGADVINISLAGSCNWRDKVSEGACPDEIFKPMIDYADEQGVFVVAAAGNDGEDAEYCDGGEEDNSPAKFQTVITVGGTGRDGSKYACSPDKGYIDVLAPADHLRVAAPDIDYEIASGTSFAAPLMSGLIASMLAENPDFTPADLRNYLPYATDKNERILPTVLMQLLDITPPGQPEEEPEIDLTTGSEFIPFSMGLYFPTDSEVWREAGIAYSPSDPSDFPDQESYIDTDRDDVYPGGGPSGVDWSFIDPYTVLLGGVLVIDEDNNVTGSGGMQLNKTHTGHTTECPESGANGPPQFRFRWDVPLTVSGELTERDDGGRTGEVSFSLGEDAEADESGTMPDVHITRDDFDDCKGLLNERDTIGSSTFPWSDVRTWPDRDVELAESLYEQIITESPFVIDDGFYPPSDPTEGEEDQLYASSGEFDGVQWRLSVGDVEFNELSNPDGLSDPDAVE